ncbi:hypothetical protein ILUMI_18202 [Ignelater luminosus]|uniref:Uncharacterized protein n=1 Tax=Ignelater luminosus TaxID=2038154 RepID=A0A8K0G6S9_IGNLU|nr:hypothetical protein ILUMI_18202 [Ignelater luminosus]
MEKRKRRMRKKRSRDRKKIVKKKVQTYKLRNIETQGRYKTELARRRRIQENQGIIEIRCQNFKWRILETAKESCGTAKIGNQEIKRTAWWTEEIKNVIKEKKKAGKKYITGRKPQDYETYKEKRTIVTTLVKESKQRAWIH